MPRTGFNRLEEQYLNKEVLSSLELFWDPAKEVGLITAGTGWGKTTFSFKSVSGLLDLVNTKFENKIQPHEMYFIVPRASIRDEQLVKNYEAQGSDTPPLPLHNIKNDNKLLEWQGEFEKKVRISTYQTFANIVKDNPDFLDDVRLLVVDEYHMLYTDNTFIENAEDVIHWIKTHMNEDRAIIGLTATPFEYFDGKQIMRQEYRDEFWIPHKILNDYLRPKYKPRNIQVITGASAATLVKKYARPGHKVLVCLQSKKSCYDEHFKNQEHSWVMTSRWGNKVYKKTGKTYAEMFNEENYEYLIKNNGTPEDIYIVYVTSAMEVGFNIDDPAFDTVIVESHRPYQIKQYFGRIRHDVENLIIIPPHGVEKQLDDMKEIVNDAIESEGSQTALKYIYMRLDDLRKQDESPLPIVKQRNDKYYVNWMAVEQLIWEKVYYHSAFNYNENKTISIGGVMLPNRREYFIKELRGLGTPQFIYWERRDSEEAKNEARIRSFDWDPWIELGWMITAQYKEMMKELGLLKNNGEIYKTLSKPAINILAANGIQVQERKNGGTNQKKLVRESGI